MSDIPSIFTNTNVFNLSDPQQTWLFDVQFYNVNNAAISNFLANATKTGNLVATSCTLPTHQTEIVTKNYFGSEKSYPVIRTYGGDCELKFDVRANNNDNSMLYRITQVNARTLSTLDRIIYHPEIEKSVPSEYTEEFPSLTKFHKITVKLINKSGKLGSGKTAKAQTYHSQYDFHNCIITNFAYDSGLDYNSEDKLTCTLTFHYDIWSYHDEVDSPPDENNEENK